MKIVPDEITAMPEDPEPTFGENDWWVIVAPTAMGCWIILSISDAVSYNDMAQICSTDDDLEWQLSDWFEVDKHVCGIYLLKLKPWSYISNTEVGREYDCGLDVIDAELLSPLDAKYFWKEDKDDSID
ncbi:hypothetical protein CL653_03555 [bacterium]|nr:hypothetical protein [bacterium]|tara:strand:- start:218 stop:601 length:384 start_codon:yes stop_codon:yes gene_type:complete